MGNNKSASRNCDLSTTNNNTTSSNGLKWLNCFRVKSTIKADIPLIPNYFPPDVLKWMKINANPKMAFKLMRVCKYFQHKKFPYLVIKEISYNRDGWSYSTMAGDEVNNLPTLDLFPECSLWIARYLSLNLKVDPFEYILSKIAACQLQKLHLEAQNITLDELKALNSRGTFDEVRFVSTNITGVDGLGAAMENILRCLSNVNRLYFEKVVPSFRSPQVAESIIVPKLKALEVNKPGSNFNYVDFRIFKRAHPNINCHISYISYRTSNDSFLASTMFMQEKNCRGGKCYNSYMHWSYCGNGCPNCGSNLRTRNNRLLKN